jgi:hypothetical protein
MCGRVDHIEADEVYGCTLLWQRVEEWLSGMKLNDLCCIWNISLCGRPRNDQFEVGDDENDDHTRKDDEKSNLSSQSSGNDSLSSLSSTVSSVTVNVADLSQSPTMEPASPSLRLPEHSNFVSNIESNANSLTERCHFAFKFAFIALFSSLFVLIPYFRESLSDSLKSSLISTTTAPSSSSSSSSSSSVGFSASASFNSIFARLFQDNASWVPISAILVLELSVGAAMRKAGLRIGGTVLGWYAIMLVFDACSFGVPLELSLRGLNF